MMLTAEQMETVKERLKDMLESLPIIAAQIGIRGDSHEAGPSSEEDRELMNALLQVSRTWQEVKPKTTQEKS